MARRRLHVRARIMRRRGASPVAPEAKGCRAGSSVTQCAQQYKETIQPVTRDVSRGERQISLTRTEFALLEMLMANPRRVLSRSRILEEVWGYDFPTSGNALEVYVGYLRRKTEADGESRLIHTVRGVGYVLRETPP